MDPSKLPKLAGEGVRRGSWQGLEPGRGCGRGRGYHSKPGRGTPKQANLKRSAPQVGAKTGGGGAHFVKPLTKLATVFNCMIDYRINSYQILSYCRATAVVEPVPGKG